ncbi:hypothetical protein SAMN05446635_5490 [Burkholderia sp. OK233]|nr:hypothetical protein SAMN05446635_5490 [Burkholderia sp. OK233]
MPPAMGACGDHPFSCVSPEAFRPLGESQYLVPHVLGRGRLPRCPARRCGRSHTSADFCHFPVTGGGHSEPSSTHLAIPLDDFAALRAGADHRAALLHKNPGTATIRRPDGSNQTSVACSLPWSNWRSNMARPFSPEGFGEGGGRHAADGGQSEIVDQSAALAVIRPREIPALACGFGR